MPKRLHYTTEAIICLDTSLANSARAIHAKRRLACDTKVTIAQRQLDKSVLFMGGPVISLPPEYRLINSRLIIIGHGDPESTVISGRSTSGEEFRWDPRQLARMVRFWLAGSVINTISIHSCFGGGNRGGVSHTAGESQADYMSRMTVDPRKSFAFKFACLCGSAKRVTARNGQISSLVSTMKGAPDEMPYEDRVTDYKMYVDGARRGEAFKVEFFPDRNASPDSPKRPDVWVLNA